MKGQTVFQRFFDRVNSEACWEWTGATDPTGYGRFWLTDTMRYAHRVAYELAVGPIPDGLDIDHLCRNRACVNPRHLEPVTRRENLVRGDTVIAAHVQGRDCGIAECVSCRWSRVDPKPAA